MDISLSQKAFLRLAGLGLRRYGVSMPQNTSRPVHEPVDEGQGFAVRGAPHDALAAWLATPLGQALLAAERVALGQSLDTVFGRQFLQIGSWGGSDDFLPLARTPRRALIAEPGGLGHVVSHASSLAVQSQSVDAVLLPHTLEFEPEPQIVLREVERVLVGEGHILILGFEPYSPWALRHRFAATGWPPGHVRTLSRRRLRDWLKLLGFELQQTRRFLHTVPLIACANGPIADVCERIGGQIGGRFASVYLLKARKRVYTLTPVRPRRRLPRALVGPLAKPV
jgi:SAM-dependent methyltransferase